MSVGRKAVFALTIVVGVICGGLAIWQLRRLAARRAFNERSLAQRDLPVVDLDRASIAGRVTYRRIVVRGRFDFDREIVLRGRLLRGGPGIHVITPLRVPGRDTAVLVNRGFVPTPDAGAIRDPRRYREESEVALAGIAMSVPDDGDGEPLSTRLGETWGRLDLTALRHRIPYPIADFYVIALPANPDDHTLKGHSLPIRVDPPPLDDGPHLSYAIQWFLIGGAVVGFGIFFVLGRDKGRA